MTERTDRTAVGSAFWIEHDQQLRELFAAGWTLLAIGEQLGTTKNAVCGRVSRLGLKRGVEVLQTAGQRQVWAVNARRPPSSARIEFPPPGRCVFPHGHPTDPARFGFCGEPVRAMGEPYCAACSGKAYQRVSKTNLRDAA